MKRFNGKAIYNPNGKAGEYAAWACNFYTGCSNDCQYCYCKKGFLAKVWSNKAQLKKCFKNRKHAMDIFTREIEENLDELKASGLFFTFTSDPMLPETYCLTIEAICTAIIREIPVQILTKRSDFIRYWENSIDYNWLTPMEIVNLFHGKIAFGFTLTGRDDLEPGASANIDRIRTMERLHNMGFKTFASIEPIVDFQSALSMINLTSGFCDLYKIGLMSGKRYTSQDKEEAVNFLEILKDTPGKFYLKDSLIHFLDIDRSDLPSDKFVSVDFNIFNSN